MLTFETPSDLAARAGGKIGTSEWIVVDQATIDAFAQATGDHQWIHVDVERARRDMPGGRTIAHGYLTLSLLPRLVKTVFDVKQRRQSINYGLNKVRFIAPVPAGSRIRVHSALKEAAEEKGAIRFVFEHTIEIEGVERPAAVAETISMMYA